MYYILTHKKLQTFAFQIIFMIAANDVCLHAMFALGSAEEYGGEEGFACQFQAFSLNYFLLASIMWSCATAWLIYATVTRSLNMQRMYNISTTRWWLLFWCQVVPVLPSTMPFWFNKYGDSGVWCWVKKNPPTTGPESNGVYRLMAMYLWNWLAIVYCSCVYFMVIRRINKFKERSAAVGPRVARRGVWEILKYYPLVLIACSVLPTLDRFLGICGVVTPFWLKLAHAISRSLIGLGDAFFFLVNPAVRKIMQRDCGKCCILGRFSQLLLDDSGAPSLKSGMSDQGQSAPRESDDESDSEEKSVSVKMARMSAQSGGSRPSDQDDKRCAGGYRGTEIGDNPDGIKI